ncbi:MAG: hypothetical protein WC649_12295 [Desulfobacteria bacterium]
MKQNDVVNLFCDISYSANAMLSRATSPAYYQNFSNDKSTFVPNISIG